MMPNRKPTHKVNQDVSGDILKIEEEQKPAKYRVNSRGITGSFALGVVNIPTTPIPGGLTDDVDSSVIVDIVNALPVAQYYVGLDPQNFNINVTDENSDETINIIDGLRIAQYYMGLIDEF